MIKHCEDLQPLFRGTDHHRSGSPPIGSLQFASVLGDYRKYFNLGSGYSFALRGSGAASFGSDSQTYFMGGMLGWINYRYSGQSLPVDWASVLSRRLYRCVDIPIMIFTETSFRC
ncbi:MAG: hypothetical protein U5J63_12170 [Fodinibius sp.]|nr:hypothetical protein [Fodinibius sp.]